MIQETLEVQRARMLMSEVLSLLRTEKANRPADVYGNDGRREIAEALTCFQTGCMYLNASLYADIPYSPISRQTNEVVGTPLPQ